MTDGQWVDDTSYRQGEPKSEQPVRVLSLRLDGTRLILHRLVGRPGWYCSLNDCGRDLIRDRLLTEDEVDVEDAKELALLQGLEELEKLTQRYEELLKRFQRA